MSMRSMEGEISSASSFASPVYLLLFQLSIPFYASANLGYRSDDHRRAPISVSAPKIRASRHKMPGNDIGLNKILETFNKSSCICLLLLTLERNN